MLTIRRAVGRWAWSGACWAIVLLAASAGCRPIADPTAAKNRVTAYLQVSRVEPRTLSAGTPDTRDAATIDREFEIYKQTLAELAVNPYVLVAALKKPGVASLPLIAGRRDQTAWLKHALHVEFDDSEVVTLWMTAPYGQGAEAAQLVNAVVESLIDEVSGKRKEQLTKRLRDLEQQRTNVDRDIRKNQSMVQSLREGIGIGTPESSKQFTKLIFMVLQGLLEQERAVGDDIAQRKTALQELRSQLGRLEQAPSGSIAERPAADQLYSELARQWADAQRAQFEAEAAGDDARRGQSAAVVEKLAGALAQRQAVVAEQAAAEAVQQRAAEAQRLEAAVAAAEQQIAQHEEQLKIVIDQREEAMKQLAKSDKTSHELSRYEAEGQSLSKHFEEVDNQMWLLRGELDAPLRVSLLQQATTPQDE